MRKTSAGYYTRVPNAILDAMAEMQPAAFKLAMALCRLTYGHHRETVEASLRDLETMTGLSRPGICKAAQQIEHLFTRENGGRKTTWQVVNRVYHPGDEVVNSVYQGGKQSLPDRETEFTGSGKQSLPSTSGLKKKKESIKKGGKERPQPDLALASMVNALVETTGRDGHLFFGELSQFAGDLIAGGYTPDQVVRHFSRQPAGDAPTWSWYQNDWRGRKGDLPTPRQVLELISGAIKAAEVNDVTEWTPTTPEDFEWLAAIRGANGTAPH